MLESCNGLKTSALMLTRYLSNHFNYWAGGEMGHSRYPRALLRVVLNQTLKHAGIRFPAPPQAEPQQDAGASSATAAAAATH